MRTADWAMITAIGVCGSVIGYSAWDYQKYSQKQEWMPQAVQEPNKAGRFGTSFPENQEDYKKTSKKQMTLDEIEWNLQDRQRRYEQYVRENK